MALSGYVGASAQDALDSVLDRRLKEQLRRTQEKQVKEQLRMEQERINIARDEAASRATERTEDRAFAQEGRDIDVADRVSAITPIGQTTPEAAAAMRKSPITRGLVEGKRFIDARPIPGTTPLDVPASPEYDAYTGTEPQRKKAMEIVDLRRITKDLQNAPDEAAKKALGFQAIGAGVGDQIPAGMLGPSQKEILAQKLADEDRDEQRAIRMNDRTSGQADRRQAAALAGQERIQNNAARIATDKAKPDPATQQAQRAATLEQAKKLRDSVGLKGLTGQKIGNKAYWYGLRDTPADGSNEASAKAHYDSLISLLAIDKLGYLKGPMSDKDIEFIKSAASDLKTAMTDEDFVDTLNQIVFRLENPTGEGGMRPSSGHGGGGLTPASSHGAPSSAIDKINALRAQRRR
jgi:hypothetical protein